MYVIQMYTFYFRYLYNKFYQYYTDIKLTWSKDFYALARLFCLFATFASCGHEKETKERKKEKMASLNCFVTVWSS